MPKTVESNNDALKKQSREWWTSHSQDYVDPGVKPHEGVPLAMSDTDFLKYIELLDENFKKDAYFAQHKGATLFSSIIPLEKIKDKKILEVGCGLGSHTEVLCRSGAIVTSIDLSPKSVETTKRRLKLKGLNADVIEMDAESLSFPDEHFDYIWSWGVIHHSPNTIACANEITRVMKPGAQIGIMLYHRNSLYNWLNVILRYGILKGKLLSMSIQDLHNRYTDGKEDQGAPLSKYYSKKDIQTCLFNDLILTHQTCFEQKHAVSFVVPAKYRRGFEDLIPDKMYTWLWSKLGFLIFSEGYKPSD